MIKVVIADDEKAVSKIIQHFIAREKLPLQVEGVALDGESALQMIWYFWTSRCPLWTALRSWKP